MLRAHKKVVSILGRKKNSNEENNADFRLVISSNMSDMANPRRRYNATVPNELNDPILRGTVTEMIKILTMLLR
jgi:hypothetical protein